jgi:catechol 2,3-dioxygenase-like lactoylglutathione lyase family enzyme
MGVVRGLHHVTLIVPNLENAIVFYQEALEFELVTRSKVHAPIMVFDGLTDLADTPIEFCLLRTENCYLEMFHFLVGPIKYRELPIDTPGIPHIAFEVSDLDTARRKIMSAGGRQLDNVTTFNGVGVTVYFRDIFGNLLKLIESDRNIPSLTKILPH